MKKETIESSINSARVVITTLREAAFYGSLTTPDDVARYWREVIATEPDHEPDRESLVVVCLDVRLRPMAWSRISLGSSTETTAAIRDIMCPVLVTRAHSFVMIHNHPSGEVDPSGADRHTTRRVHEAAMLMQLCFADHVIVSDLDLVPSGPPRRFSFRESGLI